MTDVNYKDYGMYYEIDRNGRVRSKDRFIHRNDGSVRFVPARELTWCNNTDGYPTVKISMNGHCERIAVHRLVALTFIPNPNGLPEVNHIDMNRLNPKCENLEWISHQDNVKHSHDRGKYRKPQYLGAGNPKARPVKMIDNGMSFDCIKHCAEYLKSIGKTNGSIMNATSQIIKVCNGTLEHYLGFHFRYL